MRQHILVAVLHMCCDGLSGRQRRLFVQAKPNIHNDNAEAILDNFWSLQYMIPAGVINGFAGPVKTMHVNHTGYSMTHAVHLRFASLEVIASCGMTLSQHTCNLLNNITDFASKLLMLTTQHIHTFRQHEKLQQAKDKALSSVFDAVVEMSVTGRVIKDLDSIFRKGADWDLGVDHILVLQVLLLAFAASCMQQHCRDNFGSSFIRTL